MNPNQPFASLLGNSNQQQNGINQIRQEMIYDRPITVNEGPQMNVLTFNCNSNPAVFTFNDMYENVQAIEVIKTRIVRSERTCEDYRNTPFIILTNDIETLFLNADTDPGAKAALDKFVSETGIQPTTLFAMFRNTLYNPSTPFATPLHYGYTFSDNVGGQATFGLCPYILESGNYTAQTLVAKLAEIAALYRNANVFAPNVVTKLNSSTGLLYFESREMFRLLPSNGYEIVGLSKDMLYTSQLNPSTNMFTVYADFAPKLDGPDAVYVVCDETRGSFKNQDFTCLSTVFFPSDNYPNVVQNHSLADTPRPLQTIIWKLPRLTLSLYSDISANFLYRTNGKPWFVELVVYGKV